MSLIAEIVQDIDENLNHTLRVPEPLRATLDAIPLFKQARDEMHKGIKGLPKTSAKLVALGVFYIEGKYVWLHRDIYRALKRWDIRLDDLIARLEAEAVDSDATDFDFSLS
jgi:hypothetical protein